jgi:hypothetical protein
MQKICEIPKAEQHLNKGPQFVDLRGFSIKIVTCGSDASVDMMDVLWLPECDSW